MVVLVLVRLKRALVDSGKEIEAIRAALPFDQQPAFHWRDGLAIACHTTGNAGDIAGRFHDNHDLGKLVADWAVLPLAEGWGCKVEFGPLADTLRRHGVRSWAEL